MGCSRSYAGTLALCLILAAVTHAQDSFVASQPADVAAGVGDSQSARAPYSGLYIFGDFLYVWPHRDNLQTAALSNGSAESLSWSGTPGVRVGAGYQWPDTAWDTEASFVYFHAKSQRTVTAPDGGVLLAVLAANPAAHDAADADGDSGLSYSVLDLDVGRSFRLDDSFMLRLFGGVRVAWIDQSLKCVYSGGTLGDNSDFVNSPVRFQGAGLTVGAESNWDICRGWGLYGKARLGLIAGRFSSLRTETFGSVTTGAITDNLDTVVPVAELGLGLHYQGEHFFFSAGYDFANWFNMVNGLAVPDAGAGQAARRQGSLTLEAVTVKVGFVF